MVFEKQKERYHAEVKYVRKILATPEKIHGKIIPNPPKIKKVRVFK